MGTAQSTLFGLADPKPPSTLLPKPAVATPSLTGLAAPQPVPPNTLQPNLMATPAPMPQLDATPDAGPMLSGAQRYNTDATGAVRSMFGLWNDEQFGKDTSALEQQLRNRGIRPGDPAYNDELNLLRDQQGKLRESSNLQAILTGGQEAERFLNMDDKAATSNLNRQISVAGNTRADAESARADERLKTDEKHYNDDISAGYVGQGLELLGKTGIGGSLLGLASKGVNKLTGGATTGLLTKGAGLLGLGGAPALGSAALSAELAAATNAAAPALSAAMAGGAAPAAAVPAAAAPAAGGGFGATVGAVLSNPITWAVGGLLAAGLVLDKNLPASSPLDKFDANSGGWTKPENFANTKFSPEELNSYYGPALEVFKQTKDVRAALAALAAPQNDKQKILAEKAYHLFSGTGNPMRQLAKKYGYGEGEWTASHPGKKKLIEEIKGAGK